jgi:hypothetical protein
MYETEFLMLGKNRLLVPVKRVLGGASGFKEKLYNRTWRRK